MGDTRKYITNKQYVQAIDPAARCIERKPPIYTRRYEVVMTMRPAGALHASDWNIRAPTAPEAWKRAAARCGRAV